MSSTFKNFLDNPPTSLREELITYHTLSEEARKKGHHKLAARWALMVQLIKAFAQYLDSSRQTSFLTDLLEQTTINDRTIEAQEIAQYIASSLTALRNHDAALAKELMGYAQETKEAGVRCRHWLALMKHEISIDHSLSEPSLEEIAVQYRANALKATEEKKESIAQHWREAACLAQEAFRKKELSVSTYVTSGNEILATYWKLSKVASHDAAKLKAEVALSLEQGNTALAQEYDNLALLAELLSSYQENLIRSTMKGEMKIIPHWKSATEFLNKSLELRRSLEPFKKSYNRCSAKNEECRPTVYSDSDTRGSEHRSNAVMQSYNSFENALKKFSEDDPLLPYQKMIIASAEQAAESHHDFIAQFQKKKNASLSSIIFAQQSYDEAIKAFQFFQEENFSAAETFKKRVALVNDAYQFSKRAAQAKEKWYTLGIPFLYWKYRMKKVKKALQFFI